MERTSESDDEYLPLWAVGWDWPMAWGQGPGAFPFASISNAKGNGCFTQFMIDTSEWHMDA